MYRQFNQGSQKVESQARDMEVRGSNPSLGSNFSLEFKLYTSQDTDYKFVFTCQIDVRYQN